MGTMIKVALAAAAIMATNNALAADYVLGNSARSRMTYTTRDQIGTSVTSGYSGVGTLFVSTRSTATTNLGGICTGSLIGGNTVLTAAHCLATGADPITSISFYLPSIGTSRAGRQMFEATSFAYNPDYDKTGLIGGSDVAAFTITGDTAAYDKYQLFTGNPFQQYTEVGTGTIGGPEGTNVGVTSDYLKRTGTNIYEYYGSTLFSDSSRGVVLYDFDDGTAEHDVFGSIGGNEQLGVVGEASSSPGDSGGPAFIGGRIATVTSFGVTGGIFNDYCGGDSIDPYNNTGGTEITALDNCTNSSIGEIGGNTLVSYNLNFLQGYLNGTVATTGVPEPATWGMMILGLGLIGCALRRRNGAGTRMTFA